MIVHVYSGLTSRCRALSQAHKLARQYNDRLIIIWPLEPACWIHYNEVFDNHQFDDIETEIIEYESPDIYADIRPMLKKMDLCGTFSELKRRHHIRCLITSTEYIDFNPPEGMGWYGEIFNKFLFEQWLKVDSLASTGHISRVYAHPFNRLIYDDSFDNEAFNDILFKGDYYKSARDVLNGVDPIGLHIRRTDNVDTIRYSPTEGFITCISNILEKDPTAKFFLSTDSPEEERKLMELFGESIIVNNEKVWGRDNNLGMKSGIIDMLCLSKCKKIIGSYTSIFSSFAAEYGRKEIEYIFEKETAD